MNFLTLKLPLIVVYLPFNGCSNYANIYFVGIILNL